MWEYTDKVREHFLNPRNVGEVENPDGVAEVGSIACGDALKLSFKLDENKRLIGGHENIPCEATQIVETIYIWGYLWHYQQELFVEDVTASLAHARFNGRSGGIRGQYVPPHTSLVPILCRYPRRLGPMVSP